MNLSAPGWGASYATGFSVVKNSRILLTLTGSRFQWMKFGAVGCGRRLTQKPLAALLPLLPLLLSLPLLPPLRRLLLLPPLRRLLLLPPPRRRRLLHPALPSKPLPALPRVLLRVRRLVGN
jgi:hypothetical protein